jgi:hypothetical protein
LEQGFVVGGGNADVGGVAVDEVGILEDDLFSLVVVAAFKPFVDSLPVVVDAVGCGGFAAQEEGDGVGAGFAEGAAAEFGDGDNVEILDAGFRGS